jgi:hypothetical protein
MTFKIEKDIPISEAVRGRRTKFPWQQMKVGDSVLLPKKYKRASAIYASIAANWARKNEPEWKFITRTVEKGVRVWRMR